MLKYVSLIAPLLLRKNTPNPVKIVTGYAGVFLLAIASALFFLATIFTWVTIHYGLDIAFLTVALILAAGALILAVKLHQAQTQEMRRVEARQAEIKGLLAARNDPLSAHIPEEILVHPVSQKLLAQIEDRPWMASAAALGLGLMISQQLIDAD